MASPRTILVTGCSEGGLGDALAQALHKRGQKVIATARDAAKIAHLKEMGMETLILDVRSPESIANCVSAVAEKTGGHLDMLLNNAGRGYQMPLVDSDLAVSRDVFELNVWAVLAVTQAFLPLLMRSERGAVVANNTSLAAVVPAALGGVYNASKAALSMMTQNLRFELAPFGIRVVELKTGFVRSKFVENRQGGGEAPRLPEDSIYNVAKAEVEEAMSGKSMTSRMADRQEWADSAAAKLVLKNPPAEFWGGGDSTLVWISTWMPSGFLSGTIAKMGGMDIVQRKWQALRGSK